MIKTNNKGFSNVLNVLVIVVLMAATGVAVYFWQNYEKLKDASDKYTVETTEMAARDESAVSEKKMATSDTTPENKMEPSNKTEVIYTPSGSFSASEKVEIQKKFIDPFLDWNTENNTHTVSVNIEKPTPAVVGYKYSFNYINEGGGNGGFLFGTTTPLEWYIPECMQGCTFSASFKAKYPELVAKYESMQ